MPIQHTYSIHSYIHCIHTCRHTHTHITHIRGLPISLSGTCIWSHRAHFIILSIRTYTQAYIMPIQHTYSNHSSIYCIHTCTHTHTYTSGLPISLSGTCIWSHRANFIIFCRDRRAASTCVYVCIYVLYACVCVYVYTRVCVYAFIIFCRDWRAASTCVYVCIYVCICIFMLVYVYVCMYVCIHRVL